VIFLKQKNMQRNRLSEEKAQDISQRRTSGRSSSKGRNRHALHQLYIYSFMVLSHTTVLCINKLKLFPVPMWFRCGSSKLNLCQYFIMFLRYLRTLYIVLSLVRHRITRLLTRLQNMCNVLK